MSKVQSAKGIKLFIGGFALLLVPILIGLGFWQLERAEEKEIILQRWQQGEPLLQLPIEPVDGARVQLNGTLDTEHLFLLDNKVRGGLVGYEVLARFYPQHGPAGILVNLGWIAGGPDRTVLPEVQLPTGSVEIVGNLVEGGKGLLLAVDNWKKAWPVRIQKIELKRVEKALGGPLYPAVLRVAEPLTAKFITAWQVVNMPPVKHQAYALQWFGLALVLITGIGWLFRDWRINGVGKEQV